MAQAFQRNGDAPRQPGRHDFLVYATAATATVGTALALWPFIDFLKPSADVLALSTTDVDLSTIQVGQRITVSYRGKPVFITRRTDKEIAEARDVDVQSLRDPQSDEDRVLTPQWLIVVGVCTHLGCIPLGQKTSDPRGSFSGWFCPCHGSVYDTSARIRQGPAPKNLTVPHYAFSDPHILHIGVAGGPKVAMD